MTFKTIFKYFFIWQVFQLIVVMLTPIFLPLQASDSYLGGGISSYMKNPLLNFHANYDGVHYVLISTHGYNYGQQAFFPLYPKLISLFHSFIPDPIIVGFLISSLAFLAALYYFAKLIELDYSPAVADWSIIALLIFPASFFFSAVYTESIFLLWVILAFYFARKDKWALVALFGFLASYTRLIGILLFPALFLELWFWLLRKRISYRQFFARGLFLLAIPAGLLTYMTYLQETTGDPLSFYHVQKLFKQERSLTVVMPYQVIWRYIRMLLSVSPANMLYPSLVWEFVIGIGFLFFAAISLFTQRLSYASFFLFAYLTPTFTGNFVSMPRYVLTSFPAFILIGQFLSTRPRFRKWFVLFSGAAFIFYLALFSHGYWVA